MTLPDIEIAHPVSLRGMNLAAALDALAPQGSRAAQLDYRARLAALQALSDSLLSSDSTARLPAPAAGLAFLAGFLRRENLEALLLRELAAPEALVQFAPVGGRKSLRILPRGVVCHWIAGNVPLLAMFSWAISAALGNRNVIRLSSRQEDFVTPLLGLLAESSAAGRQMAEETIVVLFDRDNRAAHEQMSRSADVRIAWGGEEAVETIRALPARWHCEDIVFGPRMSLAVVDPSAMTDRLTDRLISDIVYFDQLACSSPQQVFVKGEPGRGEFDRFVQRFTQVLGQQSQIVPRHPLDFAETYQISLDRTRALFAGGSLSHDDATQWTVAVLPAPRPDIVCANRFVQLIPFTSWEAIIPQIPGNVQTVVTALTATEAAEFTQAAAPQGVCRFPRPGEGNHFENPWDGVPIVSRLTRWVVRTEVPHGAP